MNKIFDRSQLTPYGVDYARWCEEQGALLRAGRLDVLDREHLAEEIESLGRSDRREIESRLKSLLMHLLKWEHQPEKRTPSWRTSIVEQRRQMAKVVKESPSLRNYDRSVLAEEYEYARAEAAEETGLAIERFPETCPYSLDQIRRLDFYPGTSS